MRVRYLVSSDDNNMTTYCDGKANVIMGLVCVNAWKCFFNLKSNNHTVIDVTVD